MIERRSCTL
jgi:hypothetical protein